MWPKFYRDYPTDTPLIKNINEPGRGIIGCEMHEINGWGNSLHLSSQEWRAMNDAKRKSHLGASSPLSSLPEMQTHY